MEKDLKELLFKDLCARLPYNPAVEYKDEVYNVLGIAHGRLVLCKPFMSYTLYENPFIEEIKPYLFPISSMTEEQKRESPFESSLLNAFINGYICLFEDEELTINDLNGLYNWFDKNHFDYRGLIPMGLAIDATGLNIY